MQYLLDELRQPLADRWAIYRHGCALALPLCITSEEQGAVTARLHQLWQNEPLPHLRIALAIALERLGSPPGSRTQPRGLEPEPTADLGK